MLTPNCPWPTGPQNPTLAADEIHIWCVSLEQDPVAYAPLLSGDETARAGRFRFEKDQRRFTVARGTLRALLGRYLHQPPQSLEFRYNPQGKPSLAAGGLRFNVSHSGELALCAISLHLEVGIDIEQFHPIEDMRQIAAQFFSPAERNELESLSQDQQQAAFFRGWTCKEAFIKALGLGLSYPLDQFSVVMDANQPARLLDARAGNVNPLNWSLRSMSPAPGYAAALAVEGHDWQLEQWQAG